MQITQEKLKEILKLEQKKYRSEQKKYLIFGKHIVSEAIKHGNIQTILVNSKDLKVNYENMCPNIKIYVLNKKEYSKFKSLKSIPEVFAVCNILENKTFNNSNILALNKINNPANLGAILRSAKAFGFDNIILDYGTVDLYNPKTVQAMQGVDFSLNIKTLDLFEYLKNETDFDKYNIITTYLDEDNTYSQNIKKVAKNFNNNKKNSILIIGNEALGVENKFKDIPHLNMKIQIAYESLNVVVAASIIMYEIMKG